jgi:O-antigen/teichoic acid export membrane protein
LSIKEEASTCGKSNGKTGTAGKIGRNTMSLLSARIFEYLALFIFSLYYIPKLGPSEFGIMKYATSLNGLFFILADFGISMMIIRDIARLSDKERPGIVGLSLFLKFFLSIISIILILLVAILIHKDPHVRYVVCIFGLTTIMNSFVYFFCGVFQGYEKMHLVTVVRVFCTFIICVAGFIVLFFGGDLTGLAICYLIGNFSAFLIAFFLCRKKCCKWNFIFDQKKISDLLIKAFPFGLFTLFGTLYLQIDSIMLFHIRGSGATGIYGAATRIIIAVCFFTEAFMGTLYPILSRYYTGDRVKLQKTYERAFWFLYITGIPATLGLYILAKPLNLFLFRSGYDESGQILAFLSILVLLRFLGNVPATLMTAINKQFARMWLVLCATILNITLNSILIPKYSYFGAAYATVIVNALIMIVYFYLGHKAGYYVSGVFPRLLRPTLAAIFMVISLLLSSGTPVLARVFLGMTVYISAFLLLGSLNKEEKSMVKKALGGIWPTGRV